MQILKPGLVLDIDDVLSVTTVRWMQELIDRFGSPEWLTAQQIRDKYFYIKFVPYKSRKIPEALELTDFFRYDNNFQLDLKTIVDAQKAVSALEEKWTKISCYLSSRPIEIYNSTIQRLSGEWFPEAPALLRPTDIPRDQSDQRKSEILVQNKQLVGIVDDSPHLIWALPQDYHGTYYLFETKEYENPSGVRVEQSDGWNELIEKI